MKRVITQRTQSGKVQGKTSNHQAKTDVRTIPFITSYLTDVGRSDLEYQGYLLHEERIRRPKVDIWMPMYWADYFKDTMDLSCLEHGAYLLLIGNYWVRQRPLPDDDVRLSNMTQLTLEEWAPVRKRLAHFFIIGGGVWRHKRIDAEILEA
ncbi:MAG: DUF1376 domain-containing protein, partial [Acidobacteriales bacterium]|nr:DUF1376 domain-containing protein [Terriglobales bacterium]